VLPMCDEPVQTYVRTEGEWRQVQDYMIVQEGKPEVEDVEFRGAEDAQPTEEVERALEAAEVIVIGPSNPIASIGPILALPGMREALHEADAPVVAVSPLVGGRSLKGPTEAFMRWAGLEVSHDGLASHYSGLIDGLLADEGSAAETASGLVVRQTDTMMADHDARVRLARETLDFAQTLSG
ncbi:hypothetical protein LCGC14_2851930, partial [marine sediment metagenome]